MTKDIDCQVFADQLDALVQGTLTDEGQEQLGLHAARCRDCAVQLRVHAHLEAPSLQDLEAAVPAHLVDTMWPRVEETLARARRTKGRRQPTSARLTWAVPALAAASVVLLLTTGLLFQELGRIQAREARLAQQIIELEEGLADLGRHTEGAERMARLGSRNSWVLALSRQERISVVGLREHLRSLPADATLLDASQVDALLRSAPAWTPSGWRDALGSLRGGEGLSVQDLLGILEYSTVSPETTIPTAPLVELLS